MKKRKKTKPVVFKYDRFRAKTIIVRYENIEGEQIILKRKISSGFFFFFLHNFNKFRFSAVREKVAKR